MLIYATDVKKFIHWYNGDRNVDMYYFDYPVIYSCLNVPLNLKITYHVFAKFILA